MNEEKFLWNSSTNNYRKKTSEICAWNLIEEAGYLLNYTLHEPLLTIYHSRHISCYIILNLNLNEYVAGSKNGINATGDGECVTKLA